MKSHETIIVEQTVSDGDSGWIHGMMTTVIRFIVPELDNLAITVHKDRLYILTGFDLKEAPDTKVVGHCQLPAETVNKALAYADAKKEIIKILQPLVDEHITVP